MEGQILNETRDYSNTFSFTLTKEAKAQNFEEKATIPLNLNSR